MEDKKLESMLQAYQSTTSETWLMNVMQLNMDCIETLHMQKAKKEVRALLLPKILVIILGIAWVAFLGLILYFVAIHFSWPAFCFAVSVGSIMTINAKAVLDYLKHILLIRRINNSGNITDVQQRLAQLRLSHFNASRTGFLQIPFYTTWYLHPAMIENGTPALWILQVVGTLAFTWLSIFLYRNFKPENLHKKWVKWLVADSSWKKMNSAMQFVQEIDDFKNDR